MGTMLDRIGTIYNSSGMLYVTEDGETSYWCMSDFGEYNWVEIPQYLYDAIMRYETERDKTED